MKEAASVVGLAPAEVPEYTVSPGSLKSKSSFQSIHILVRKGTPVSKVIITGMVAPCSTLPDMAEKSP